MAASVGVIMSASITPSCKTQSKTVHDTVLVQPDYTEYINLHKIDSLAISNLVFVCDSLNQKLIALNQKFTKMKHQRDSINDDLFVAGHKVENIRWYVNLCMAKPAKYDKYFKGWVRVASQEHSFPATCKKLDEIQKQNEEIKRLVCK